MDLYLHKDMGIYMRLITLRKSNVNTFLEVDKNNKPIRVNRSWSVSKNHKDEQVYIINGFKNLCKI